MPGRGEEISGVSQTDEVVETTDSAPVESTTPEPVADDPKESVRDTVARELAKLKAQTNEDTRDQNPENGPDGNDSEPDNAQAAEKKAEPEIEDVDPELLPPERFGAKEKQLFANLPKGLKRGLHRTIKNLEALATREKQELRAELQRNRMINETLEPYAQKWEMQGIPRHVAMATLAAAHEQLTHPNEETRVRAYLKLASDSGIDLGRLAAMQRGEIPAPAQQNGGNPPPEVLQLREEVGTLKSYLERQQIEAAARPIIDELNSVKNERDLSGRYRYPMLHEGSFVQSLKPLVSELVGTVPGITYGEALKRAYVALGGEVVGTSAQPYQTRLPSQTNTTERARAAAASVRGRSSPGVVGHSSSEPPPEALASPRDTVRWALEQLRRG